MQQCCDHPYLVDQALQVSLIEGHPVTDILDIGVRASGKLLLLDKMLGEIKGKGQRVLILSQVIILWYHALIISLLPLYNFGLIYVVMSVMCDSLLQYVLVSKELASIIIFASSKHALFYFWQLKHAMISFTYF